MSRLDIDFSWPNRAKRRISGIVVAFVTLAVWAGMGWHYATLKGELDTWEADRQRLSRREAAARPSESAADAERLQAELRQANRVIDALARPWDELFSAVDNAYSERATLLAVEPDTERREVRLTAEAKDYGGMLEYVRSLRATSVLRNAILAEHQVNVQDPQRPIRFVVLAPWSAPRSTGTTGGQP